MTPAVWETAGQATAAVLAAAEWVNEHVAGLVETVQNHVGEIAFAQVAEQAAVAMDGSRTMASPASAASPW